MFDIGWTEMLVIAVVMIVVVGPKDLPRMLRTFGKMTSKVRGMAGDFQKQFNEALKEAELDDVKKSVDTLRGLNPASEIRKHLNPFEKAAADVRAGLDSAMKPKPSTASEPASPVAHEAEPLKNGSGELPGVSGPDVMPASPALATPAPPPQVATADALAKPMVSPQVAAAPAVANGTSPTVSASRKVASGNGTASTAPKSAKPKPTKPVDAKPTSTELPAQADKPKKAAMPGVSAIKPPAKPAAKARPSAKTAPRSGARKPAGSAK